MVTQEEWLARAENLRAGEEDLVFTKAGFPITLVNMGEVDGASVDLLTRTLYKKLGLRHSSIVAPDWFCAWRGGPNVEMKFAYWVLGYYGAGIFLDPEEKGGGFDKVFFIEDMPTPDRKKFPEHLKSREERSAWLNEPEQLARRERRKFTDALALWHFANHLFDLEQT